MVKHKLLHYDYAQHSLDFEYFGSKTIYSFICNFIFVFEKLTQRK